MSKQYIGIGLDEDMDEFIKKFVVLVKDQIPEFEIFHNLWKECNFSVIFLGHPNPKELLEFTREVFRASADCLFHSSTDYQVGALYLLYSLFRSQPVKPIIRARITQDHWSHISKIHVLAKANGYKTLLFVIKFLIKNGFDFVAQPTLMGPCTASCHNLSRRKENLFQDLDAYEAKSLECEKSMQDTVKELLSLRKEYIKLMSKQSHHGAYDIMSNEEYEEIIKMAPTMSEMHNESSRNDQDHNIGQRRSKIKAAAFTKTVSHYLDKGDDDDDEDDDDDLDDPTVKFVIAETSKRTGKNVTRKKNVKRNLGRPRKNQVLEDEGTKTEEECDDSMPADFKNPIPISPPIARGQKRKKLLKCKRYYDHNTMYPSTSKV